MNRQPTNPVPPAPARGWQSKTRSGFPRWTPILIATLGVVSGLFPAAARAELASSPQSQNPVETQAETQTPAETQAPPEGALPCPEIDLFFDAQEQVREKRTDSNGDCQVDQVVHYAAGLPERAAQDRDHDGRMDSWLRYGEGGALVREERDRTGDGQADTWTEIAGSHPTERREDRNADGQADIVIHYVEGRATSQTEDSNLDGQPDRFTRFEAGVARSIEQDRDHDGQVDARAEFDAEGNKRAEHQDEDRDGDFEIAILYRQGVRERVEEDTRGDGRPDVVVIYATDAPSDPQTGGPPIARREVDSDGDGRFESVARFESGSERTRHLDADGDGFSEVVVWLLADGRVEREAIDSDASGHHDVTRHYSEGRRIRDERDADADGRPERITLYDTAVPDTDTGTHTGTDADADADADTDRIADRIAEEQADTTGDGLLDTRIVYREGRKHEQFEDRNADGQPDARYRFDPEELIVFEALDADADGRFESEADFSEGVIQQRRVDSTGLGRPDRVEFYRGGNLQRVERDSDQDGRVEAWVFYDEGGQLARREEDTDADGRVDRWLSFGPGSTEAILVETDTRGDGVPDTWRIANAQGVVQRLEEDRNGDHRVDSWVHFEAGEPTRYEEDRDFDGRMDARGELDADGAARQTELDSTGDARFDLRQSFEAGVLVREERDTRADQVYDVVTRFEGGARTRQEIDSNGDGRFDTLLLFVADLAVEQRRDTTGDGDFDQTVALSESGAPTREEFDTDGDGKVDLVRDYAQPPSGTPVPQGAPGSPGTENWIARESVDGDGDGRFEQVSQYSEGEIRRTETDADGDGQAEDVVEYEQGRAVRRSQDRNARGQFDRVIHYIHNIHDASDSSGAAGASRQGEPIPLRIEEDSNGDGNFDTVLFYTDGVHRRSERDSNANRATDIWIFNDATGLILRREEDRSGDGAADFIVHFREGVARRVETRRPGDPAEDPGCTEVTSWLNKAGDVIAEEKDSSGDCQMDTWSYYASAGGEAGRLTRQARDSDFDGQPDLLVVFDAQQRIRSQELAGPGGRPNKKIFLDASGGELRQCLDGSGDGRFDLVVFRDGNVLRETWLVTRSGDTRDSDDTRDPRDSDNTHDPRDSDNPRADQRDLYEGGLRVRVEIDTQGQGRPDVVQYLDADERVVRQDEDSNHDGLLDLRFENDQPVPVPDPPKAPAALEKLDCGGFDPFWDTH